MGLLSRLGVRYVIGLGVIVLVVVVLAVAHFLPHRALPPLVSTPVITPTGSAVPPSAAASPGVLPGPSGAPSVPSASPTVPALHRPVPPKTSPGQHKPQKVATLFADAWLDNTGSAAKTWATRLAAYTTPDVATQLATADPANVPANHVTDDPTVVPDAADQCTVRVPMDTGTLVLTLTATGGKWLVSAIDWDRS